VITKHKIITKETLKRKLPQLRRQRKVIAFTNGCFDLIHYGHISYLQDAKQKNRILIVGLNSDASVRKIKGSKRPIIGQSQRAAVLASLACVDYVVIFGESTPEKLIAAIKPDVLIKGADWKGKKVAGSRVVRSYGGKVQYIKYISSCSTTKLIKVIFQKCKR